MHAAEVIEINCWSINYDRSVVYGYKYVDQKDLGAEAPCYHDGGRANVDTQQRRVARRIASSFEEVVHRPGFQPGTSRLVAERSVQLSYRCVACTGRFPRAAKHLGKAAPFPCTSFLRCVEATECVVWGKACGRQRFFVHLAAIAFFAISRLRSGDKAEARARPPFAAPFALMATACGSRVSGCGSVASATMDAAS